MDAQTASCLILQKLQSLTEKQTLAALYPDDGPLRRELYVKHIDMLHAGAEHNERVTFGGNRVGKTWGIGGYETALHMTGEYPYWWKGHRFTKPMIAWGAGTKGIKVRDVNQKQLIGKIHTRKGFTQADGGLIPAARIRRLTRKTGVADAIDQIVIRHKNGYENELTFKSYEEGRQSFESEEVNWIWLDEEKGLSRSIYDECRLRLLTAKGGSILSTFTPVEGLTETVISMLEDTNLL